MSPAFKFGRVIPRDNEDNEDDEDDTTPLVALGRTTERDRPRSIPAEVVDAAVRARTIVDRAEEDARRIVQAAESQAKGILPELRDRLSAELRAEWAAAYLKLESRDRDRKNGEAKRVAEAACVLAERLVGSAIAEQPELLVQRARNILDEAAGATIATFEAHPSDVPALEQALTELSAGGVEVGITCNNELQRGSLIMRTNVGDVDARLSLQLERLTDALERALAEH